MASDQNNQLETITIRTINGEQLNNAILINTSGGIIQENIQHASYNLHRSDRLDGGELYVLRGTEITGADDDGQYFRIPTASLCKPTISADDIQQQPAQNAENPKTNEEIVVYLEEGEGEVELQRAEVETIVRQDLAELALRPGRRSEVWGRFGNIMIGRRRVKNFVACLDCKQVYSHESSHTSGTSTLKKHKCSGPPPSKNENVNVKVITVQQSFPAEINPVPVIVSTGQAAIGLPLDDDGHRPPLLSAPVTGDHVMITDAEHSDLAKKMMVFCSENLITGTITKQRSFHDLAFSLVSCGRKYGTLNVVSDVLIRPNILSQTLHDLAAERRARFIQDVRGTGAIAVSVHVELEGTTAYFTICCGNLTSNVQLRFLPLRFATLPNDPDLRDNAKKLIYEVLSSEGLTACRRAIVSNIPEIFEDQMRCEKIVKCAQASIADVVDLIFSRAGDAFTKQLHIVRHLASKAELLSINSKLTTPIKVPGANWTSLVETMQAIVDQEHYVLAYLKERDCKELMDGYDRSCVSDILAFLQPFKEAHSKLRSFTEPTAHTVLLWKQKLLQHCTPKTGESEVTAELRYCGRLALKNHFPVGTAFKMATILHPTFKHLRKFHIEEPERSEIYEELRTICEKSAKMDPHPSKRRRMDAKDFAELWDAPSGTDETENEFDEYLDEVTKLQSVEGVHVLNFWKSRKVEMQRLFSLVSAFWSLPATAIQTPKQIRDSKDSSAGSKLDMFTVYLFQRSRYLLQNQ